MYSRVNEQVATHPVPVLRAAELVKWYNSPQFSGLQKRSRAVNIQYNTNNIKLML